MKNLLNSALLAAFGLVLTLGACKKKDDEQGPTRQFMTSGIIAVREGATSAVITWREAVNVDTAVSSYTVEVSRDSTFSSTERWTYVVASPTLTVTDSLLQVRVPYYARVKTNGVRPEFDSKWVTSARFNLTGEQIFLPVRDAEIKHNSVILRWNDSLRSNLIKIVLTTAGGAPVEYPLTAGQVDSGLKKIDGLTPSTKYHAQIFSDSKEKGYIDFETKEQPAYSILLDPTMDLAIVLDTCAANSVIGLDTGTYRSPSNYNVKGKSVTLMSVSGNPNDTKVIFKEIKLMGTGAGINLKDISFDGGDTGLYFINFAGLNSDGEAASFADVTISNCRINSYGNCLIRANRGTATGDHKINNITISSCIISNNKLTNAYTEFTFDKLAFQTLSVTNTTWYNAGRAMILASTVLPAGTTVPTIVFDHNTINNFGSGSTRVLLDANANPIRATFTNNIIANTPRAGTLNNDLIRATGAGTAITFSYNNYFKLQNGSAANLNIPSYVTQAGNLTVDLGWTATTTTFTLPGASPVRSGSSAGGAMGDPRWH